MNIQEYPANQLGKLGNLVSWQLSRPNEKNINFKEIAALDLPVNEFHNINLFIESTIFEREIISTLRNHIMWAQTSRVQNVLEFKMHPELRCDNFFEKVRSDMKNMAQYSRQDDYRLLLPLFSMTKYSISTNPRQLIKIFLYLNYLSELEINQNIKNIFKRSAEKLLIFLTKKNYDLSIISNYKLKKILNEDIIVSTNSQIDNSYYFINSKIPLSLRAQLFRHRELKIKDDLFNMLFIKDSYQLNLSSMVDCSIIIDKNQIKELFSKRLCWIAQYNIWKPILSKISNSIKETLPCSDGVCPFNKDAILRYEGKDPNPPCPIHLKLNNLQPSPEQVDEMRTMIYEDERPELFWNTQINMLETKI